jgi:Prenyltransferase and squalene oxidase repeat
MTRTMATDIRKLLIGIQDPDGGFGARPGQQSEAEPTALAALALDDDRARTWLVDRQREDGSLSFDAGRYVNDSATALAALALSPGPQRERALDHLESTRARHVDSSNAIPIDASAVGWAWASGTASWVEPTARALWALRLLRTDAPAVAEAVSLLRDRESSGGGWNYGNREVLGEELPPFAQTTAIALIGLRSTDPELEARGLSALRRLWRVEAAGGLSLATAVAAFRLHDDHSEANAARAVLEDLVETTRLGDDVVSLAWSALATGNELLELR